MAKPRKKPAFWGKLLTSKPKWDGEEPGRRQMLEVVKEEITAPVYADDHLVDRLEMDELLDGIEKRLKYILLYKKRDPAVRGGKAFASQLARTFIEVRILSERAAQWTAELGLLRDAFKELMLAQLEVEGTKTIKLDNDQAVITYSLPHAQVNNKELFRQWCLNPILKDADGEVLKDEAGNPIVLPSLEQSMHLHWGKTNEICASLLESNQPLPPGVDVYHETRVSVDKGEEAHR